MDKADHSFCKFNRSMTKRCVVCGWPFRCSVEQLHRDMCAACESLAKSLFKGGDDAVQPPT